MIRIIYQHEENEIEQGLYFSSVAPVKDDIIMIDGVSYTVSGRILDANNPQEVCILIK